MTTRSGQWRDSTRAARLPPNWRTIVATIKARDHGLCQATTHDPACTGAGTDVDHLHPGDDHTPANLQLLSTACHRAKTQREAAEAHRARAAAARHPHERHPGLL